MDTGPLVMTLLVRDEDDILRDCILFHLARGVDRFVITDNRSVDGTADIIDEFVRSGVADRIYEAGDDYRQSDWTTRMVSLARDRHGASRVICNDADEFWWSACGDLKSLLARKPEQILKASRLNMLPDLAKPGSLPVIQRFTLAARIDDPSVANSDLLRRLGAKVAIRPHGLKFVEPGNHGAVFEPPATIGDLPEVTVFHYPVRSPAQFLTKAVNGGGSYARNTIVGPHVGAHKRRWFEMHNTGTDIKAHFDKLIFSDAQESLIAQRILVRDERMASPAGRPG